MQFHHVDIVRIVARLLIRLLCCPDRGTWTIRSKPSTSTGQRMAPDSQRPRLGL